MKSEAVILQRRRVQTKTIPLMFYATPEVAEKLRSVSRESGHPMTTLIEMALLDFLPRVVVKDQNGKDN